MNAIIKITCKACGCSMEIEPSRYTPNRIACQNCRQLMDPTSQSAIGWAMEALQALPEETQETDGFIPADKGFRLELKPVSEE